MKKIMTILVCISINFAFAQPNTNNFTWTNGSNLKNQASQYGVSSNTPGARDGSVSWTLNGKIYLFGGIGHDKNGNDGFLNDLWEYNPSTNNWTFIKGSQIINEPGNFGTLGVESSLNSPSARYFSASWILNNKLYLFGGQGNLGLYNDLWVFNPTTNNWTWIKGANVANQSANHGSINVENSTNNPGARVAGMAFKLNSDLYLFGGDGYINGTEGLLNDLWKYNSITNNWTWIKGSNTLNNTGSYGSIGVANTNNLPPSRFGASSWSYNNKFYLFGGLFNAKHLSDLWEFNPSTNNWTWIKGNQQGVANAGVYGVKGTPNSNNKPGDRKHAGSVAFNGKLLLFGGELYKDNAFDYFNDFWEYNPSTNNWTWINGTNQSDQIGIYGSLGVQQAQNMPGSRKNVQIGEISNKIYFFGGRGLGIQNSKGYLNDLWEYDPIVNQFKWIKGRNIINTKGVYEAISQPGSRMNAYQWLLNGKIYLFGGVGFDENGANGSLNDLWEHNPNTNSWAWINGSKFVFESPNYGTINIPTSSNNPGCRYAGGAWVNNNKLYLFGGTQIASNSSISNSLNDIWEYNPSTTYWTWIKGSSTIDPPGNYGTIGMPTANTTPGGRYNFTIQYYNNKAYLFGGYDEYYVANPEFPGLYTPYPEYYNDLWVFDHATNNWTWLKGVNDYNNAGVLGTQLVENASNNPKSRAFYQSWQFEDKLFYMGGGTQTGNQNDLWQYNINTNNWTWLKGVNMVNQAGIYGTQGVPAAGNTPGSRKGGTTWIFNNKLYLMGGLGNGSTGSGFLNDIWQYKPSTNNWVWLKGSFGVDQGGIYGTQGVTNATNVPGARAYTSAWTINKKLYLFGGSGFSSEVGSGLLADLWSYVPACTDGQTITNGNWNNTTTWFCEKVPTATEEVKIYGHTIDLTSNAYAKSITYFPSGTLRLGAGGNLQLNP